MNPKITVIEITNFISITPKKFFDRRVRIFQFDSFSEVFMGMHGIVKSPTLSKLITHSYVD